MKDITIFENIQLGAKIRKIDIDGEPWFVANDVCEFLGYTNPHEALRRIKDLEGVAQTEVLDSRGASQSTNIISEAGLYMLVFGSSKPEAVQFKRWVAGEVLPSIRKRGAYISPSMTPEQLTSLVERHITLFERLGGVDERDEIFYKDALRGQLLLSETKQGRSEWPISDRVIAITGMTPKRRDVIAIGKRAALTYRVKHNQDPPKREQFVDGATRLVCHYSGRDLPMLDRIITEYYSEE